MTNAETDSNREALPVTVRAAGRSARKPAVAASLQTRLLVVLVGLVLLPVMLIGGLAYNNARHTVEDRVIAQLTSVADLKEQEIVTWLKITSDDAQLLARNFLNEEHFTEILDPATDPQRRRDFASFLADNLVSVQQARAGYVEIMMVDTSGRVIVSTTSENVGTQLADYPTIAQVFDSPSGTYTEDIHRAPDTGQLEMAFGHVMHRVDLDKFERTEEVIGAIVIRVNMDDTIYPLIRAWPGMGASGETLLVRPDGDAIVFLNPLRFDMNAALDLRIPAGSANALPAQLASAGQEGIITTPDYRGTPVLAAYRYIPEIHWGFVAKEDVAEAFAPVTALTRQWVIIGLLVLPVALLTAIWLSQALTRPLAHLVDATRRVAAGDLETHINIERTDEIGDLARAFQAMVDAVRESHDELTAHSDELAALFDLSQDLLGTLNVRDALEQAIRKAMAGTNLAAGAALLMNAEGTEISVQAIVGRNEFLLGDRHTAPGYALLQREPVMSTDLDAETEFGVPDAIRAAGVKSILAVPMLVNEQACGALVLDAFERRTISPDEVRVAQAIANQTALAVERARLFADLSDSYDRTLDALVAALDTRDNETEGHSKRVVAFTLALAGELRVPVRDLDDIRRGALLHDIGKIGVPDAILHKPGPLTDDEWMFMRAHPELGARMLKSIRFLAEPAAMVLSHHERWDGGGYPRGLASEDIPLGARIFSVADTFDAITSDRPYRRAQSYEVALDEITRAAGTQFDPDVVAAFRSISPETWDRLRIQAQTIGASEALLEIADAVRKPAAADPPTPKLNEVVDADCPTPDCEQQDDRAARPASVRHVES
ncbi:MAG: HD domain-containing phosphohydrolase [Anaerolineales bacterium]